MTGWIVLVILFYIVGWYTWQQIKDFLNIGGSDGEISQETFDALEEILKKEKVEALNSKTARWKETGRKRVKNNERG